MEKQHLKRLSYGFSALVMSLSAVAWMPSSGAYAAPVTNDNYTTVIDVDAATGTMTLTEDVALTGTITVATGETLTVELGGNTLSKTSGTMFVVPATSKLVITGEGSVDQGVGVVTDSASAGEIDIQGGTYVRTPDDSHAAFNSNNATIKITGGTFSNFVRISGAGGIMRGSTNKEITGGTFSFHVVPDGGYTAYASGDNYIVKETAVFTGYNTLSDAQRTLRVNGERALGTINVVTINGSRYVPTFTVTTTVDGEEVVADAADYEARVNAAGYVFFKVKTAGTYNVKVTDANGDDTSFVIYCFDIAMGGATVEVAANGEAYDLSDTIEAIAGTNVAVKNVVVSDANGTNVTIDGKSVNPGDTAGDAVVTVALKDNANTTFDINVHVVDSAAEYAAAVAGENATVMVDTSFDTLVSEIEGVTLEAGLLTVPTSETAGETTVTISNGDEDNLITKDVKIVTYKLKDNPVITLADDAITMTDYVEAVADGYEMRVNAVVGDGVFYNATNKKAMAQTADDSSIFTYDLYKTEGDVYVGSDTLTVYVKKIVENDATKTINVGDTTAAFEDLYNKTYTASTLTVELDGVAKETDDTLTAERTGAYVLTFTEKVGNTVINEHTLTYDARGYVLPATINMVAGGSYTWEFDKTDDVLISYDDINTQKVDVETVMAEGKVTGFTFTETANAKGTYTVKYIVTDGENAPVERTQTLNVYTPITATITSDDATLDLVNADDEVTLTLAFDAATTVSETVTTEGGVTVTEDAGVYTIKATDEAAKNTTAKVTFTQLLAGDELATKAIEIAIVDTAKTVTPAEAEVTVTLGESTAFEYTYENLEYTDLTAVVVDGEDATVESGVTATISDGNVAIATTSALAAGTYTVKLKLGDDVLATKTVTVTAPVLNPSLTNADEEAITVVAGHSTSYAFDYEDIETPDFTVTVKNAEDGEVTDGFTVSADADEKTVFVGVSPMVETGVYTVVLTETTSGLSTTKTLSVTRPTIHTEVSSQFVKVGESLTFTSTEGIHRIEKANLSGSPLLMSVAPVGQSSFFMPVYNEEGFAYIGGMTMPVEEGDVDVVSDGETVTITFNVAGAYRIAFEPEETDEEGVDGVAREITVVAYGNDEEEDTIAAKLLVSDAFTAEEMAEELEDADAVEAISSFAETKGFDSTKLEYHFADLYLVNNDNLVGMLTDLDEPVKVTIAVAFDEPVAGYARKYTVFYYHNGEVYEISSDQITDNGDGTISFMSSQFSVYAVAYTDEIAVADTGAATSEKASALADVSFAVFAAIAAIALAGAAVVAKRK